MTAFWCARAWLPSGVAEGVTLTVTDGVITAVETGTAPGEGATRLPGLVLPGLADAHSHAFHRALRGRTHDRGGTFWSWRRRMYALAATLDPDRYLALARATYAELALAGVSCVGEFHYLHHGPGGRPYDDPNAMGEALAQAAAEAGIRLTLLDACYLAGGLGPDGYLPPDDVQIRFCDGDVDAWAARVSALPERPGLRVGAAVHSVRAVPRERLAAVAVAARGRPLHVHVSEQQIENQAALQFYGRTPAELLGDEGVLGPATTAVHAVHVSDGDRVLLGGTGTTVCACPTTEADLADGIGPFRDLRDAGCPIVLGTDQHVTGDVLAEARALEAHERLRTGERGRFLPVELLDSLTVAGHAALGWPDAGRLAPGGRADLVAVALDSPRTAGADPAQITLVSGAADVTTVVVDGRVVVAEGRHVLGDVGALLRDAVEPLWVEA
jgi:formiminoglutamate deiminase